MVKLTTLALLLTINAIQMVTCERIIFAQPGVKVISAGDTIDFYCNIEKGDYKHTWERYDDENPSTIIAEGEVVKVNDSRIAALFTSHRQLMNRYTLTIKNVTNQDIGMYRCFTISLERATHKTFHLKIKEESSSRKDAGPEDDLANDDKQSTENSSVITSAGIKAIQMTIDILKSLLNKVQRN